MNRSFRHWTPYYILDRLILMYRQKHNPDDPWLTSDMIKILDTLLRHNDCGLEFGSGRSTSYLGTKVSKLISVEHDAEWFRKILPIAKSLGVDYRLCQDGITGLPNSSYVNVHLDLKDESLDFVLVDGVSRDYCTLHILKKIKPGGMLIIDNVNWYLPRPSKVHSRAPFSRGPLDKCYSETWSEIRELLVDWRYIWTSNGIWDTACWFKP